MVCFPSLNRLPWERWVNVPRFGGRKSGRARGTRVVWRCTPLKRGVNERLTEYGSGGLEAF
jgi:hypothetical protein